MHGAVEAGPCARLRTLCRRVSCLQTQNAVWKRNRNSYARLLLEQLRGHSSLDAPFSSMPPDGALPNLPAHLMYRWVRTMAGRGLHRMDRSKMWAGAPTQRTLKALPAQHVMAGQCQEGQRCIMRACKGVRSGGLQARSP